MWTPSYDIIVETLTGSEFEVTVNDLDTVGYIKSKIQKYEGIPVNQQHLLYKHKELTDAMVMKDIPLVNGSRLKLVLGLKGGPISSKRLVTISSDCDNWLDMSDVLSGEDLMNLQSPGLKLLLYKDNKKNVHRLMKVRAEKAGDGMKSSISRSVIGSGVAGQAGHGSGSGGGGNGSGQMSQKERDIAVTKEKLAQIKAKLSQKKKRLNGGGGAQPPVNGGETGDDGADVHTARQTATMVSVRNGCDLMNEIDLSNASRSVYRHKKRHNQHYHHHHHHHHQHQQQHLETVIKEEKCPIGYHRPTTGYDGSLHTPGSAGAAGGHRKSMPAVIDFGRQKTDSSTVATAAAPSFNYGLVNVLHGGGGGGGATSARTHTASALEQEKRSQIREHLQRNRSFKTISAKSLDFGRDAAAAALHLSHTPSAGLERSLSFHSNGILNRMDSELGAGGGGRRSTGRLGAASTGSISASSQARLDGRGRVGVGGGGCTTQSLRQLDEKVSSASLHDLIELLKFTPSRKQHRTFSNDALNKLVVGGSGGGSGGGGCPKKYGAASAMGKKSLPDINPPALNNIDEYIADYDIGMKASNGDRAAAGNGPHTTTTVGDCKIASAAELAFKSGAHAAGDKTAFRALYKSTSSDDGGTVYELPKLLVREDSPVESFLASYSQLETVATVQGDSPKNTFTTSAGSLEESSSDHGGGTTANLSDSLLEVPNVPHGATATTAGTIGDVAAKAKLASESLLKLAAEIAAESRSTAGASVVPSAISPPPGATLFGSNGSLIGTPGATKAPLIGGGGGCSSSWCHHWNNRQSASYSYGPAVGRHHSELGINELELKFVRNNDRVATIERVELLTAAANGDQCGPTCDESNHAAHASDSRNVIKLPALSGLEINTGGRWLQMTAAGALRFSGDDDLGDDDDEDEDDQEEEDDDGDDDDGDNEEEEHDADDFGDEDGGCDLVGQQVVVDDGDEADGREERISSSSCSSIRRPRATSNSTSFIHSHLSISSDEDDLFSVAELGGGAGGASSNASNGYRAAVGSKSKSIDLNEFRKAFGSSPTLLNALGTGTSVGRLVPPQLSRLETIPSQYRRGYTNLNDACLSSSTSELECVSNGAAAAAKKKLTTLLAPDGTSELSPLLKHRASNEHIAYVRSNENLNRYKALFAATPSSFADGGSARRRSSENGETVGGGGDALYLRHQRQSHGGLGASASGARHLPGIRDHLASIADSAEMVGDSIHGSGDGSTCSNLNDDDLGRCFTVGGDFECRFSRLSCCSVANGGTVDKVVSPRSADGSRLVTGGGSDGAMRTDGSTVDDRNRMLFGGGGTVMDGGNGSSTPLRRQSDYYFPSDESLFNMDSFFDDFVEIDTSDIFDSAEFINISAPPLSHHRHLAQQNHHPQQQQQQQHHHHHHHHHHHLGTRKSVSSSGLLLPDILHQQQQQQPEQPQQQPQHAVGHHYQYLLSKDHQQHGPLRLNTADRDGDGIHFSASRRIAQMQQHHGPQAGDIDLDDEPGIASIIQHIDREQLCDRGATTTLPPATINSRSVGNNNELGDRIATERLLRLPPRSDLGLFGSAGAVLTFPAEPFTDRARDDDERGAGQPHQQHHATEQIKSKKLRCAQCNKKLGVIMIMKCHCEKIFCAQHRYAEAHNCSYDFKLQGRKLLERENPLVVAEKLPKI